MGSEGFLDQRGSGDAVLGRQRLAVPDRHIPPGAILEDAAAALQRRACGRRRIRRIRLRQAAGGDGAQGDDLDRLGLIGIAEALAVHRVEARQQRRQVQRIGPGHQQFEGLAVVAHVGGDRDLAPLRRHAVARQPGIRLGTQFATSAANAGRLAGTAGITRDRAMSCTRSL